MEFEKTSGQRAAVGTVDELVAEIGTSSSEGPLWAHPSIIECNLSIGDSVETNLVRAILRLHDSCAREMERAFRYESPFVARSQLKSAASLTRDVMASIKELVAYRAALEPKVRLRESIRVGQKAKLKALLAPDDGSPQAELVQRIEDISEDWDRVASLCERESDRLKRAVENPSYEWGRISAGRAPTKEQDARAWRDLTIFAIKERGWIAREWAKIERSYARAVIVYESAPISRQTRPPFRPESKRSPRRDVH